MDFDRLIILLGSKFCPKTVASIQASCSYVAFDLHVRKERECFGSGLRHCIRQRLRPRMLHSASMVTCCVPISLALYATSILVTVVTSTLWSATATEASTGTTGSTAATLRPLRSSLSVGSSIERSRPCPSSLPSPLPPSEPLNPPLPPSLRFQPRKTVCWPGRQAGILVLHQCNKSTALFFTHYTRKERQTIDGRNDEIKTAEEKVLYDSSRTDVVWWEAGSVALLSSWLDHHGRSHCSFHGQHLYDFWWIKNMSIKSEETQKQNTWYQLTVVCGSFLTLHEH